MFRQYEDPYALQEELERRQESYERRVAEGEDIDSLIDAMLYIEELKDRINFAWQDIEYDEMYADEYYGGES